MPGRRACDRPFSLILRVHGRRQPRAAQSSMPRHGGNVLGVQNAPHHTCCLVATLVKHMDALFQALQACFDASSQPSCPALQPGKEGPWMTYARMVTLRTPKHLTGLDYGMPSLTFQSYYEARFGKDAWAELDKIPKEMW